jgi:hypothetical protein
MGRTTLITTVALAAAFVAPATAAAAHFEQWQPGDTAAAAEVPPPPSLMAAGAGEGYQELRSQEAVSGTSGYTDLRSPDARDAAIASAENGKQDLRSPDARDVGREPTPVPVSEPVVEIRESPTSGFDWGDAGIGAAAILALLSIAVGLTLMVAGRRRRGDVEAAAH